MQASGYIGRFAPSPTGPLHLGSLLAALASFLDARSNHGLWLLRMEDLDPPREPPGTADLILRQLESLNLNWDGSVLYQSSREDAYYEALRTLQQRGLCYFCDCSRSQIRETGSVYDGHCRNRADVPRYEIATRVKVEPGLLGFIDQIQGNFQQNLELEVGDFIIRRKDQLFAYQLAVVVDDDFQRITHVVRGSDLLDSTPRQIFLQRTLGYATPEYAHIPIIVNDAGQKLSKQHFADSIELQAAGRLLYSCLHALGQNPDPQLKEASIQEILQWGIRHWDIHTVPRLANISQQQLSVH